MSSPTGPAEQLAGGSLPRSTSSLLILLSDIVYIYSVDMDEPVELDFICWEEMNKKGTSAVM